MTRFEVAVRQKQWEVVCLYLLLGVSEAASRMPPESLSALLDLLVAEDESQERSRDGDRRGR
jgi:hypothetical protein